MFALNETTSDTEIVTENDSSKSETPCVDPTIDNQQEPKHIDESLLIESLTLSIQDLNENLNFSQFETEEETLTPAASIENIAAQCLERNVVHFDVFDESSEDFDGDSTPTFINDHQLDFLNYPSAKKLFHRSISMPFGRQMMFQECHSLQVSRKLNFLKLQFLIENYIKTFDEIYKL